MGGRAFATRSGCRRCRAVAEAPAVRHAAFRVAIERLFMFDGCSFRELKRAAAGTDSSQVLVPPMLVLTTVLLLLLGIALGLARRPWWEVGVLTLLAWAFLEATDTWMGDWRRQVGLPGDEHLFERQAITWLLVGVSNYACYGLAFLYSRWRLARDTQSDD
jgi:hypothetical protein